MLNGLTKAFYAYEERGRGWRVYDLPVDLEPPCEAPEFLYSGPDLPFGFDDGRSKGFFSSLFTKSPQPPKIEKSTSLLSYPNNPARFECESELRTFGVTMPKGYEVATSESEQLLHMLASSEYPIAYEIMGTSDGIFVQWTCRDEDVAKLVSMLKAYFPGIGVTEYPPLEIPLNEHAPLSILDLGLKAEFLFPIASPTAFSPEPLIGLFAWLENLIYGEVGMFQVLFKGTVGAWGNVIKELSTDGQGGSFFENVPELPKLAQEKVSSPLYGVVVRVMGQGVTKERSNAIADNLADAICKVSKSSHNELVPLSNRYYEYDNHVLGFLDRMSYRLGCLLNSSELVNLVHLPTASIATSKFHRHVENTKALPPDLRQGKYALGLNEHQGQRSVVYVTDKERLTHCSIQGSTGMGKSTLIVNSFLQDVQLGVGACCLDPHGDLVDDILLRLPADSLDKVILVDPSDTEFPIGFNLFQATTDIEKIVLSSDLVEIIRAQATSWGDSMTNILANAINTFLESPRGGTLVELRKFLVDPAYRNEYLTSVSDTSILAYWKHDYQKLRKDAISPLLTRLDTFLRVRIVRNMMAQPKGLDFNEILRKDKIVLIKLSQGLIGEANSYLLGTLFLSKFYQAAQARQALSKDTRKPYYLYIDEASNMVSPSLSAILSGARKYALGLTIVYQELAQIDDNKLVNSLISNPGIRICFRTGDADAKKLESGFSGFEASDLQRLSVGKAIARVGGSDRDFNLLTIPLSERVYPDNINVIKAKTRATYSTSKQEVEEYLDRLNAIVAPSPEHIPQPTKLEPLPLPPKVEKTIPLPPQPMSEPLSDFEESAKRFTEEAAKRRQTKEHAHLQALVQKLGQERGYKAQTEAPAENGGRIDVLLTRDKVTVAVEIGVTNTVHYEVQNLEKCIASGHTHIVMVCGNQSHLDNIRAGMKDDPATIEYLQPEGFSAYLDKITPRQIRKETRIKGYTIETIYNVERD